MPQLKAWDGTQWIEVGAGGMGGAGVATIATRTLLQEIALGSDGAISFTGIDQDYDDLELEIVRLRSNKAAVSFENCGLRINNDSGNVYSSSLVQAAGSPPSGSQTDNAAYAYIVAPPAATAPSGVWAAGRLYLPRYTVAEKHNLYFHGVTTLAADDVRAFVSAGLYQPASPLAITQLDLFNVSGGSWLSGSIVRLYGVKTEHAIGGDVVSAITAIETIELGSDGPIQFAAIPGTYKQLRVVTGPARHSAAAANDSLYLRFNGDTGNNYAWDFGRVTTGPTAVNHSSGTSLVGQVHAGFVAGDSAPAGASGSLTIDIPGYANASFWKNVAFAGFFWNATGATIAHSSFGGGGIWRNVAAITQIDLLGATGANFKAGTVATLYGLS